MIEELRAARRRLDVSVAEVVAGTGASRDTVYALEAERILSPGFFTVVELAERLNLSVEFLASQGKLEADHSQSDQRGDGGEQS